MTPRFLAYMPGVELRVAGAKTKVLPPALSAWHRIQRAPCLPPTQLSVLPRETGRRHWLPPHLMESIKVGRALHGLQKPLQAAGILESTATACSALIIDVPGSLGGIYPAGAVELQ